MFFILSACEDSYFDVFYKKKAVLMKKKFWTSDKLVGIVAIFISLITLIIFVKQTNIMEKQSRLSVMPYLLIETSDNGLEKTFTIDIVNYGVGPAIIEEIQILYNKKTYTMDFHEFAISQFPEMDSINIINSSSIDPGLAISSEGVRTMIKVGGTEDDYTKFLQLFSKILADDGFDYMIKYRSIYNDHWIIRDSKNFPEEVK